ncbi:MAG TPA: hypothetical protein VJN64_01115 [Terriglobales bacterium]|nr:hypothetical protein [Terriglobales bacterium]
MLVTRNVVTREEVIATTKELAEKLGRSPRYPELIRVLNVTRRQIQRMFGGWAAVLEESGCERVRLGGGELTMHELWHDWMEVARKAQRMPTIRQYEKFSRYSVRPLKDRFRDWDRIPAAILEYGDAKQLWAGWEDVKELMGRVDVFKPGNRKASFTAEDAESAEKIKPEPSRTDGHGGLDGLSGQSGTRNRKNSFTAEDAESAENIKCGPGQTARVPLPERLDPELLYAEPLNLSPLATAPQNEMGVVFLFGVMARELGFVVLKIRPGFPDCIALRRLGSGKWQWVRIEFEFESKSFVWHGHDPNECDLIVCWENTGRSVRWRWWN